jgi:hypothetical protein
MVSDSDKLGTNIFSFSAEYLVQLIYYHAGFKTANPLLGTSKRVLFVSHGNQRGLYFVDIWYLRYGVQGLDMLAVSSSPGTQ